ncbi:hypothetical protein Taro_007304 [Colocasia esculenta]|uniref:RNase H type-1 domain-containing protein n=1 Tax=Colocasia esculenta TaxID=4460 RepID=A0A843TUN7_COLES|nr:hypothetical protein [Colocasia esculenta]
MTMLGSILRARSGPWEEHLKGYNLRGSNDLGEKVADNHWGLHNGHAATLQMFIIPLAVSIKLPSPVSWIPPSDGYCLNIDGASKGNPGLSGGEGCIRDKHGAFLCGFSFFYGMGSSTVAEVRAVYDGLRLEKQRNLNISILYSDSHTTLQAISAGRFPHWAVFPWWRRLLLWLI